MKIIYHCFGGSHSSVTAAALHLGLLPADRTPTAAELKEIPFFDEQLAEDHGEFKYMGEDSEGNQVYLIGKRNLGSMFEPLIRGLARIFSIKQDDMIIVDTLPCVNWLMVVGGVLSRKWGIVGIGRPIVIYGTQLSYGKFNMLVDQVKSTLIKQKEGE